MDASSNSCDALAGAKTAELGGETANMCGFENEYPQPFFTQSVGLPCAGVFKGTPGPLSKQASTLKGMT